MRLGWTFVRCVFLFLCAGCVQEQDYIRDYPQIEYSTISAVTPNGVTIEGTIGESVFEEIVDHGVVWFTKENLSFDSSPKLSLGKPTSNSFTAEVRSDMLANKTYYFRAYARTGTKTVYGKLLNTMSLGSEGPKIETFAPLIVVPKDILTITGKRFGTNASKLAVSLKGNTTTYPATIKSVTDTEIQVVVPEFAEASVKVMVAKTENPPVTSEASLLRRFPTINSIRSTDLCSTFDIIGKDLLSLGSVAEVTINNKTVSPKPVVTDSTIRIPATMHAKSLNIVVSYNSTTMKATKTLDDPAKLPTVESISATDVPEARVIYLRGNNFPLCGGLSVQATSTDNVSSVALGQVKSTEIPVNILATGCSSFKIILTYGSDIIYTSASINPLQFDVTSVTPAFVAIGSEIQVLGTNLAGAVIKLGTAPPGEPIHEFISFQNSSVLENSIVAITGRPVNIDKLYKNTDGTMRLTIEKCSIQEVFPVEFRIAEPVLTDFNPKTNDGQTGAVTLTITGVNLIDFSTRVFLEQPSGQIVFLQVSIRENARLVARIPAPGFMPAGQVTVGIQWFGRMYRFPTKFDLH